MERSWNCREIARIIARDMVSLDSTQFPLPAPLLISSLSPSTLIGVKRILEQRMMYRLNVPMGFTLLFLMPRKIPWPEKREFFMEILDFLANIREDFSQRRGPGLRKNLHELPEEWIPLDPQEYRKVVFLLDNVNELRVPVFRGWGMDIFALDKWVYRAYNLGNLKRPEWVYLRTRGRAPRLNVFGHVLVPEEPREAWVSREIDAEEILRREMDRAEVNGFDGAMKYVKKQWEEFLGEEVRWEYRKGEMGKKGSARGTERELLANICRAFS